MSIHDEVREALDSGHHPLPDSVNRHLAECRQCQAYRLMIDTTDRLMEKAANTPGAMPGGRPEVVARLVEKAKRRVEAAQEARRRDVEPRHPALAVLSSRWLREPLAIAATLAVFCLGSAALWLSHRSMEENLVRVANRLDRLDRDQGQLEVTVRNQISRLSYKQALLAGITRDQMSAGYQKLKASLCVAEETCLQPAAEPSWALLAGGCGLATCPVDETDRQRAIACFEMAAEFSRPGSDEWLVAQFGIGFSSKNLGLHEKSLEAYKLVIRILSRVVSQAQDPKSKRSQTLLAMAHHYGGWASFKLATRTKPYDPKRLIEAIELYRETLRLVPDYPKVYYNLALADQALNRSEEANAALHTAREICDRRIAANDQDGHAYWQKAFVAAAQNKPGEALELLTKAIQRRPAFVKVLKGEEAFNPLKTSELYRAQFQQLLDISVPRELTPPGSILFDEDLPEEYKLPNPEANT